MDLVTQHQVNLCSENSCDSLFHQAVATMQHVGNVLLPLLLLLLVLQLSNHWYSIGPARDIA